ncbi:hypothetical protein C0J52_23491 [Blattella germanica]|nr:hypothetical protein C0J52_23491 [Blattella germanica]
MQGEFNRLKETETASDREKTKLQNRMVKLQNQKNNIEIQLDCIESSVKELANICTETSRKNINTPSPTTTTCHGEACYMSTKIIKTAYNYIKELCKDIQNLKSSLQERDEIITNIQQKDK